MQIFGLGPLELILLAVVAMIFFGPTVLAVILLIVLALRPRARGQRLAGPPSGWYADPSGHNQVRWWDGSRWTEHVGNDGVHATEPMGH